MMDSSELIPNLALFTLVAAAILAVVGYVLFKRKRANRHPMDKSPDGAVTRSPVAGTEPVKPTIKSTDELR